MSQNPQYFIQKPRALVDAGLWIEPQDKFITPTSIFDIFQTPPEQNFPDTAITKALQQTTTSATKDILQPMKITEITKKLAEVTIAELTPPTTPRIRKSALVAALPVHAPTLSNASSNKLIMESGTLLDNSLYDKLIIGALMFRDNKVLLLQRSQTAAAMYPLLQKNYFELPSADIEASSMELQSALALQSVFNNTGLEITTILDEALPMECDILCKKDGKTQFEQCVQLNFVVKFVGDADCMILKEDVHCSYVWKTKGELDATDMTTMMRKVVKNGFEIREHWL